MRVYGQVRKYAADGVVAQMVALTEIGDECSVLGPA